MCLKLLLFLCLFRSFLCMEVSLRDYLEGSIKNIRQQFDQVHGNQEYWLKFNETEVNCLAENNLVDVVSMNDRFVVDQNSRIYQITNASTFYQLELDGKVKYLKATGEFEKKRFFLVSTDTFGHIYEFNKDYETFSRIQAIGEIDGDFFVNNASLYFSTKTALYKYRNGYFDEIQTMNMKNFQVFGRFGIDFSESSAVIYELHEENFRAVQKIGATVLQAITFSTSNNKLFVYFQNERNEFVAYIWTGLKFTFWERFPIEWKLEKMIVFQRAPATFLLSSSKDQFILYDLTNGRMDLVKRFQNQANDTNWFFSNKTSTLFSMVNRVNCTGIQQIHLDINITHNAIHTANSNKSNVKECFLQVETSLYKIRDHFRQNTPNIVSKRQSGAGVKDTLKELAQRNLKVKSLLNEINTPRTLIINETVILKHFNFQTIKARELQLETRDEVKDMKGKLSVGKLTVSQGLDDLLVFANRTTLKGHVATQNLHVNRLRSNVINNISMSEIYYKKDNATVQGLKEFASLSSRNATFSLFNGLQTDSIAAMFHRSDYKLNPNLTVDNLWVGQVNGIHFSEFQDSVVRLGRGNFVNGSVTFRSARIQNGTFSSINGGNNQLTSPFNQTVTSKIYIDSIFTKQLSSERINGIDFARDVRVLDDNVIDTPITIDNVEISNNLIMHGESNELFNSKVGNKHIVGTNESDLLQIYNSKVIIEGDLYLDNLQLDSVNKIQILNQTAPDIFSEYWSKTQRQTIPNFFEASQIQTPHLFAKSLNNHEMSRIILTSNPSILSGKFYFDQVTINGSLFVDLQQVEPNLKKIDEDSVKTSGSFKIFGHKNYSGILKIGGIQSPNLGNIDGLNMTRSSDQVRLIVIKGNLNSKLVTELINDVNVTDLVTNACSIDGNQSAVNIAINNLTAFNFNSHQLNELIKTANLSRELKFIPNVRITGDVNVKSLQADSINNTPIKELLKMKVVEKDNSYEIYENVQFTGLTSVNEFSVVVLNGRNLPKLTRRLLYKKWPQTLTATYSVVNLKSNNLITNTINNISIDLIDRFSSKVQNISSNVKIEKSAAIEHLVGRLALNLRESLNLMQNPLSTLWNSINVNGNITLWEQSLFSRIFEQTVTEDQANVITGFIRFNGRFYVKNMTANRINGVDIDELVKDAVLDDDEEVVVSGKKVFAKIHANQVYAYKNVDTGSVNNIDISEIDQKIVSKYALDGVPVKGMKIFFEGLQINRLQTEKLGNVTPQSLVVFDPSSTPKIITQTVFESLEVQDNLNIGTINNMDLNSLLTGHAKLNTSDNIQMLNGTYFITDLYVGGNISTKHVNGIPFKEVVLDEGLQTIEGPKVFAHLSVHGNVQVDYFDNVLLSNVYEQALLTEDAPTFDDITVSAPAVINGNIYAKSVNGFPMNYDTLPSLLYSTTFEQHKQEIHRITNRVTAFISDILEKSLRMPREMSYLENSTNLQIFLDNTRRAEVSNTNDGGVLLHITSEEAGSVCQLPRSCACPTQRTLQLSPQNSLTHIVNKETQRIFTHIADNIHIHVITNTISTSEACRTNGSFDNEWSYITWNVVNSTKSKAFYMHQTFISGYISDVKFFTLAGKVYVVIGRYYDPVLNMHNLNSILLKFSDDLTQLKEVQTIDAAAVWSLSLVYTTQGVILVTSSKASDAITRIFRFNLAKDQFDLLRDVSIESTSCVGVVLVEDSLLILADRYSTLQILKYHAIYDNYYFYQTIPMDYPIQALSVIYTGEYGISSPYLTVVTKNKYLIYSYKFIEGWKLESTGHMDELNGLIPFKHNKKIKLFAPSSSTSTLLTVAEYNSP